MSKEAAVDYKPLGHLQKKYNIIICVYGIYLCWIKSNIHNNRFR